MPQTYRHFTHTYAGLSFDVTYQPDDLTTGPEDHCELLGTYRETYQPYSQVTKQPGERIIHRERGYARLYDYAGAVAAAKRAGCTGADAAKAADAELRWLSDFYAERWIYAGLTVSLSGSPELRDSVWAVEDYHYESDHAAAKRDSDLISDLCAGLVEQARAALTSAIHTAHASGAWPAYA